MRTMVVKLFYSEISGSKEIKKRQQRIMMILDSKNIPYEPIDITEAGQEAAKDFMLANAKPRGDSKVILSPQIFSDDLYCGDYDDFDLANENDVLEQFLNTPKIENNTPIAANGNTSRESSAEADSKAKSNGDRNEDDENSATPQTTDTTPNPLTASDPEVAEQQVEEPVEEEEDE